ncbi:MAG: PKD domain-containing protein [Candidatus Nanohaloarchaea archaeon]
MRKLVVLTLVLILGLGMVSAADYTDLEAVEDPDMVAGETGEALLEFTYEGDHFEGERDPFVLNVSFDGARGENFEVDGELSFEEGGLEKNYSLECTAGERPVSRGDVGEFYRGKASMLDGSEVLCFTEDAITVLPSFQVVDGEVDLNVTPDVKMEPGTYDVDYEFAGWTGLPEFDPVVSTGENGVINGSSHELLENQGIEIVSESNVDFTVVGYSYINAETDRPGSEEFALEYYEFRPHTDVSGVARLEYDQESIENRQREDPRLYGCSFEEQDCSWERIAQGDNGVIESDLEFKYPLYGVFTSNVIEEDVVTETETSTVTETQVVNQTKDEEVNESVNETETVEVQRPTAFFSVEYTEPDPRENVRFDASNSYSPDSEIESYEWSFGDEGPQAVESFEEDEVNVTLTVEDENAEDSYSQVLNFETAAQEEEPEGSGPVGGFARSPFNPLELWDGIVEFFEGIF